MIFPSLIALACLAPRVPKPFDITAGYSVSQNLRTKLWDTAGAVLTSVVHIESVNYSLAYHTTQNTTSSPYSTTYQKQSTGNWGCILKFHFNSSSWSSYPTGAVWLQVCNYIEYNDLITGGVSFSDELDWFQGPNPTGTLVSVVAGDITAPNGWTAVHPKAFLISAMTVDTTDPSGKTGYISYSWPGDSSPAGPFDDAPAITTIYHVPGVYFQSFIGVLWVFAKPNSGGENSTEDGGLPGYILYPPEPLP